MGDMQGRFHSLRPFASAPLRSFRTLRLSEMQAKTGRGARGWRLSSAVWNISVAWGIPGEGPAPQGSRNAAACRRSVQLVGLTCLVSYGALRCSAEVGSRSGSVESARLDSRIKQKVSPADREGRPGGEP